MPVKPEVCFYQRTLKKIGVLFTQESDTYLRTVCSLLFDGKNFREENAGVTKAAAKDLVNRKND